MVNHGWRMIKDTLRLRRAMRRSGRRAVATNRVATAM
jgi:hypothetical protein